MRRAAGRRRRLPIRWLTVATLAVALSAAPNRPARAQRHDTAEHFLGGSFRGSALRGLLPERILSGVEQPEAQASGDFDARGGPELAVSWREDGRIALALLRENDGGAWKKMAEVRREFSGVDRMEFVAFEQGDPQALLVLWFIGGSVRMGQLEVFAYQRGTDGFESILTVPASSYRIEDVDDDRVPELVVYRDAGDVPGVPEVLEWERNRLVPPAQIMSRFFEKTAKRFLTDGEAMIKQTPRGQAPPLPALDSFLNAAKCLEQAGKKSEAFRAYRRVAALGRTGILRPRRSDALQQFRDMRTEEARESMARLLGKAMPLRVVKVEPPKPVVAAAAAPATPVSTAATDSATPTVPAPVSTGPAETSTSAAVATAASTAPLEETTGVAPSAVETPPAAASTPEPAAPEPATPTPTAAPPPPGEPVPPPPGEPLPGPPGEALPPPPGEPLPAPPGQ